MIGQNYSSRVIVCATWVAVSSLTLTLLLTARSISAQQLPVRTYTTADGLPRDLILRIVRDSHGFLWFCTGDGLSRFNGYEFTNYGVEQGLPHPIINDLLETRRGVYWVATNGGGVARFNPSSLRNEQPQTRNLFTAFTVGDKPTSNRVNFLYEDREARVWAGTDGGLFRLDETNGQAIFRRVSLNLGELESVLVVRALVDDKEGSLWVSTQGLGLVRRLPDGRTVRYKIQPSSLGDLVESLMFDPEGRLWIAHRGGAALVVFKPDPAPEIAAGDQLLTRTLAYGSATRSSDQRVRLPDSPGEAYRYTTADGLASDSVVGGIYQSADGRIWIGTDGGLTVFSDGRFRSYTMAQGLSSKSIWREAEDRDGNLWLASATGAMKITWSGFTTFGNVDGLSNAQVRSVFESQHGELCVTSDLENFINHFDGQRFNAVRLQLPREIKSFGWGWNQVTFQDHTGEWWVPTLYGLYRFPHVASVEQLAHTQPKALYNEHHGGLPGSDVFRLFEDSRGDIWISISGAVHNLVRWERATESFHAYSEAEGLPRYSPPTAFREDAAGNLWLGFYEGGLARYRDGRFRVFTQTDGMPAGPVRALYLDHIGRMWVATGQDGVARVDDPQADHPHVIAYTTADGLSSNGVSCIIEDKLGRMYFGTARGLDQFDLETKHVRHYTKADGLPSSAVTVAFRDRQGALWFGTDLGLSRLITGAEPPKHQPPPIMISGLRIAGDSQPISALGETEVSGLVLSPNQNQLSIDFVGLGFAASEGLKYQYKLVGASEEWSVPTDQRTINYAGLSPGKYRFVVQAVTTDGIISPSPATISFTIMPPFWERWWFVTLALTLTGLVAAAIIRNRVTRLIELERVRTRIAADLHDDIGSALSRIAILSEVTRRQGNVSAAVGEPLGVIAGASRDLVDSMSDIVWAINPNKDHLHDLVQRMRRFASDLFTARQIEFSFDAPGEEQTLKIGADLRRQVFLIFKEAVNNVARHSGCTAVQIEMRIENRWLTVKVADNGAGFDSSRLSEGQGLISMRARAKELGGNLEISSNSETGTTVLLKVSLAARVSSRDGRVH